MDVDLNRLGLAKDFAFSVHYACQEDVSTAHHDVLQCPARDHFAVIGKFKTVLSSQTRRNADLHVKASNSRSNVKVGRRRGDCYLIVRNLGLLFRFRSRRKC